MKNDYYKTSKIFRKLLKIGKKIESEMKSPQDIEWGIDSNNNIYIFQARPIIINKRKINKFQKINIPKKYILGNPISYGFTIGQISDLKKYTSRGIILQSGKLKSKDLTLIINSKAVLLKTGGYLSHFANIIREFNKPSIIIGQNEVLELSENYIVDGYNGYIYKLRDLKSSEKKKAYWNYFVDLIYNGNKSYLNSIGIKNYKFYPKNIKSEFKILNFIMLKNKIYIDSDAEIMEVEFFSTKLLNNFIGGC